jgi:nitrate reductase alpha subunit
MQKLLVLAVTLTIATSIGCSQPGQVGPEQFKQAIKWAEEYPVELAPSLETKIQDDKFDQEEFKSFEGQYHRLVHSENMGKVKEKVATIKVEAQKLETEQLLAKYKEAAANQGLVVTEVDGEIRIEKAAAQPEKAETASQLVKDLNLLPTISDSEIDAALQDALSPATEEE